jgi:hypothetical protein
MIKLDSWVELNYVITRIACLKLEFTEGEGL